MSTLAAPSFMLDRDASTPAKRDQFGVAGVTAPGASVDIILDGTKLSTITADTNGRFAYQLANWPTAGAHELVAVARSADGQTATSSALRVDIGSQPPTAPTITSAFFGTGYVRPDDTFLYGVTTPAATVRIMSNGEFLLATRADASGFWHIEVPTLADGSYSFSATATNNIGTTSGASPWNVKVDSHAPDAPLIMLGDSADTVSSFENAVFSGTAEALAQVTLSIDGIERAQAGVGADGRWLIHLDLEPGTHQAMVTATDGASNVSAPSRTLAFSVTADVAGNTSTAAQLPVGASVQGTIEKNGDHDWYRVTLDANTLYQFRLTAAESNAGTLNMLGSGMFEDYLHLWDPQGTEGPFRVGQITQTQYGNPVTILFAPTRSGDYFLDMGANYVTGTYTLTAVVLAHDDHANDTAHATALPLNGTLGGVINYTGDIDQFGVTLRAGVSYTVTLDSGGAAYGSVFRELDKTGGPAARVAGDYGSWHGVVTMSIVPSQDGVYYVGATGGTGDTVPYHITLTEAPDDYLASIGTAGRVLPGTLARGKLESQGDADWFKATLVAGQTYLLQALSADGHQLDLSLFDGTGKELPFGLSVVYGADSMLWTAPVSGDHYFQVASLTTQGDYTLLVTPTPTDDFGASIASAGALTPAASVAGALETPGDVDWLKVSLTAGSDYVFTLDTRQDGHTLDSAGLLQLLDGAGLELASARSGSKADTAELVFHATTTGDYYLAVSDPQVRNIGTYGVSMFGTSQDTMPAGVHTSATLSPGGMINSSIDFAHDTDWIRVDLKARQSYYFELTGTGGRGGTLPSNLMSLQMVDANGSVIAAQTHLYGKDPTLSYYASVDATYYIAVTAWHGATGTYTLKERDDLTPYLDTLPPLLAYPVLPVTAQVLERHVPMALHFDELVQVGGGTIMLHLASGELVDSFSAADGNASVSQGSVSLILTSDQLEYATDYVLTLAPGSVIDLFNHSFEGTQLSFRTADAPPRQEGGAGNDVFFGRNGDELIDGKAGRDVVRFKGAAANYQLSQVDGAIKVNALSGAQGHDTLVSIERVLFDDLAIAYDIDGNAGQAYRLYQAAFDRTPDVAGLGYWIARLDHGTSLNAVADAFLHSAEFEDLYGAATSDRVFVEELYGNVLHRALDQDGADYWMARLRDGVSRADILIAFSESSENQAAVIGQISKGMTYYF